MRKIWLALFALGLGTFTLSAEAARAEGYLHADGTRIVDGAGRPVILRGMGLGGWMLQEGYMFELPELGQQHVIRQRIAALIGEPRTAAFYRAWLDTFITKADIDAMAGWGFNSIRLPIHYDQLTLPADREPVVGKDSWNEEGFRRIDRLLAWAKANGMYLILDLHAAPGGQGTDNAISDRDPAKPSLWDSPENRRKTIALWRELARRYADDPGIGAYDIINEPNWDFDGDGGGHGCKEKGNVPLRQLQREITGAIRAIDRRHLIVIEGNCWGNNYAGVLPPWDDNMALSFHKYWNRNGEAEIAEITGLRDRYKLPIWLGETGENSNAWYRDMVALVERHAIGWSFWPLKKIGFNQPLEIVAPPGWPALVAYLTGKGPRPNPDAAYATLMQFAANTRFDRTIQHRDVVDALFRQPYSDAAVPFRDVHVGPRGAEVSAADYDMGAPGIAYADTNDADYHVATGGERLWWNLGRTYRNDGVDIGRGAGGQPYVEAFDAGEWMRYTISVERAGRYGIAVEAQGTGGMALSVNGDTSARAAVQGDAWHPVRFAPVMLEAGRNTLVLRNAGGSLGVRRLLIEPAR